MFHLQPFVVMGLSSPSDRCLRVAGVARLSAGRIAILQFVYPLTAVAVDALVYGRTLDAAQPCGLVLMLAALFVAVRPPRPTAGASARHVRADATRR